MAATTKIVLQVDCEQEDMITTKLEADERIDDTFRMIDVYMYMHADIIFGKSKPFRVWASKCWNIAWNYM